MQVEPLNSNTVDIWDLELCNLLIKIFTYFKLLENIMFFYRYVLLRIYRWLSRSKQLGVLVPVLWLGVPLRFKVSKLEYPLRIPPLIKKRTLV